MADTTTESTIDRVLRTIDVGLQRSSETGYVVPPVPGDIDYQRPSISLTEPYPRVVNGRTVWACCESSIGPPCEHVAGPRRRPPRHTRSYRTWCDRIDSGRFTKSQCGQFGRAVVLPTLGHGPRGSRSMLREDECIDLVARIRGGVMLEPEHTAQGLAWLTRYGARVLGWSDTWHAEVLATFSHFTYHGDVRCFGPTANTVLPVWRIHLRGGTALDYYNAAWQVQPWGGDPIAPSWWFVTATVAVRCRAGVSRSGHDS